MGYMGAPRPRGLATDVRSVVRRTSVVVKGEVQGPLPETLRSLSNGRSSVQHCATETARRPWPFYRAEQKAVK